MFYNNSSKNCFLFDDVGSFHSSKHSSNLVAFVKMSRNENGGEGAKGTRAFSYVVIIVGLTGMPTRFTYNDLQIATNNFFVKLGEGGFGSVYQGTLPNGTRLAVKKLEVGTAKGLAYLHEDCDVKIVHCDIKPENVLLDDNFLAKVSDFGLAKLMTREQSHVFTTLRGTRGYLAPEWITNYAISEKSYVDSYGMLLLEIIGGRKNFDPSECSEKSYFPSFAFKMLGKLIDILDPRLSIEGKEESIYTAIKVALWCIQEDMHLRSSMNKVVQMLEGLFPVPKPPMSSPLGSRLHSGSFESTGVIGDGTISASALSEFNGGDYLSAVRLSGPR
ncbi:G-type lectin S-receptor-like serine/threonine-protein kinase SD2-5 [Gossypium australe]|uniref:non-specific serine/threonine protein kinase n=1 Tax=Gossypium australe TaxID=47621 RepID=A0A5B6W7K2_9ROSI|nr:G-type lectin S-receptor-like serine/threonine-protein kinase SD2-5 [Gossypium australe]